MSGVSLSMTRIMRNFSVILLAFIVYFSAYACTTASYPEIIEEMPQNNGNSNQSDESMTINVIIGSKVFKANIEMSETGMAFIAKLPLTLDMSELNGNEKYCYGISLPRSDKYFDKISSGDLMLYSGNCIVLFYGQAGNYSYTRIGKLDSTEGLATALGNGTVSVKFDNE